MAAPMTATAIEFDRVAYVQPSGVPVLEALTLDIRRGEVIALVGRSGAGKTTVLRLINRLALPQQGRVLVGGRDTTEWDPIALRRSIGYVIQDVGLFPHMTVAANIGVVPRLERWEPAGSRHVSLSCSTSSASPPSMASAGRRSFPAGSGSGSALRGRSRPILPCC